jgi:hypothetical protein
MQLPPYDPVGALGGLFAPAYIHGNPQSEAAVQAWTTAHPYSPGVTVPTQAAVNNPQQRDVIAAQVTSNNNPQWAAMRAQMSPSDIATFQSRVSPAEFSAFMAAGTTPAAAAPAAAAPVASVPTASAPAAQQPAPVYSYAPQDYYGGG